MGETKHTQGPWAIETPCGFPYTGIYVVSHKANKDKLFHSFIAEVRQYRENGEAQANARLIAAAPDLLAACRYSLERYEISDTEWARAVCTKCREAIAKAEKP